AIVATASKQQCNCEAKRAAAEEEDQQTPLSPEESGPGTGCHFGDRPRSDASIPSPQSEAVVNELQGLTLQPGHNLLPITKRRILFLLPLLPRCSVLQLKLQQRRTREELVNQGIMPPLKSSAAFHKQRRSLERARTEDYLKRKIRSRPERSELIRMHILEGNHCCGLRTVTIGYNKSCLPSHPCLTDRR
uniref:Phosphatase and actin regulator n=1 Tax=Monopterus albus TaxID=43700 RepID=A0A3Q3JVN7_MONAL